MHVPSPPPSPKRSAFRDPVVLAALAGTAILAVAVLVVWLIEPGKDTTETGGGSNTTVESTTTTQPSNQGSVAPRETTTTEDADEDDEDLPDLPPPTFPDDASPPTTGPDTPPGEWPLDIMNPDNSAPLIGEVVVDLEPDGYIDVPVALREGQLMVIISSADDGIMTHIEIFRPDGTSEGSWEGGEPEVINGWEWTTDNDRVPMTGTFVIRVIHLGGDDRPFALSFFGEA